MPPAAAAAVEDGRPKSAGAVNINTHPVRKIFVAPSTSVFSFAQTAEEIKLLGNSGIRISQPPGGVSVLGAGYIPPVTVGAMIEKLISNSPPVGPLLYHR